ncbi:MAG: hypothetical protein PWQ73_473 [Petrotoga sp.]|jgi:hypothetical protein|nr:hypothetical protein [Petrotoga sp.]
MGDLAFIVLNYQTPGLTIGAVENIRQNIIGINYKILVVDNGSSDNSFCEIKEHFVGCDSVEVISTGRNLGYAQGNNIGLNFVKERWPKCKYVAIMNPDVRFFPNTNLFRLCYFLEKEESLAAIAPVHLLNGKLNCEQVAWKIPQGTDDILLNFSITNRVFRPVRQPLLVNEQAISYVEVIPGSFFIIKFNVFESIGFFDENTFLYCEERILGKKLKNKGYKLAVDWKTFYLHLHDHKKSHLRHLLKDYNILLKSRIHFNKRYNENKLLAGLTISTLLILYPVKIIEILAKYFIKKSS